MHLLNRQCRYKAYKYDKSNFVFKSMLLAMFTEAHAAFGRGGDLSSPLMAFFGIMCGFMLCLIAFP